MTCKQENECCKFCHRWTWVVDGSHCLSDSKRKRETFEVSPIPVFSRPPPVPHSLWNDHRTDGPWAMGLSTPLSRSHAWLSVGKGIRLVLSREAGVTPGCCSHMLTATQHRAICPHRQQQEFDLLGFLIWFGLVFCCPEFSASVQTKGPSFLRKKGLRLGTGEKKILRAIA